jgi:DNA polymerase III subunit gamma/tau
MYQVIARKYRPTKFSELISQEHVRTTLENAITQRRIAHGYILSGQRGTGKTTVARIIARCLNCIEGPTPTPCGVCASCREIAEGSSVDVIEIDAASNRGINEMRELRDNIRYRPARDHYKVFIIDEAHQITSEAFNALLKTLEEPPEWVVFILCTTESHKIPVTIASRCQQFSFRSVDFADLMSRLRWICEQEGIQADDEVLSIIARVGEGSVRDSLSALDQAIACCGTSLSAPEIRNLLGLFSLDSLEVVAQALERGDAQRMIEIVQELESHGRSLHHFCRELARYLRNLLVARIAGGAETRLISASAAEQARLRDMAAGFSEEDLTRYMQLIVNLYTDMQTSLQPRLHLELGLLRLIHAGRLISIEQALGAAGQGGGGKVAVPPRPPEPAAKPRKEPSPFAVDTARKTPQPSETSDARTKLLTALTELGFQFTADAIEHSEVSETAADLSVVAPKEFSSSLSVSESQLRKAAEQAFGRPMRIRITAGNPVTNESTPPKRTAALSEEEVLQRALADPAVQRFREAFPNAEIRHVRDLKE